MTDNWDSLNWYYKNYITITWIRSACWNKVSKWPFKTWVISISELNCLIPLCSKLATGPVTGSWQLKSSSPLTPLPATSGGVQNQRGGGQYAPPPSYLKCFSRKEAKILTQLKHKYNLHVCKFLKWYLHYWHQNSTKISFIILIPWPKWPDAVKRGNSN